MVYKWYVYDFVPNNLTLTYLSLLFFPHAYDFFFQLFSFTIQTHMDSPSHVVWNDYMYNGQPSSLVGSIEGASIFDITNVKSGILSRAFLIDIPRILGIESYYLLSFFLFLFKFC